MLTEVGCYCAKDFTFEELLRLVKMLCESIECCHSNGVIHRDLKLSNLLLLRNGALKLADLGLARICDPSPSPQYTSHVVTQWYRPLDVFLGNRMYGTSVDMWSLGCIAGELLYRKPLFQPSSASPDESGVQTLAKIIELCGSPVDTRQPSHNFWPQAKHMPLYDAYVALRLPLEAKPQEEPLGHTVDQSIADEELNSDNSYLDHVAMTIDCSESETAIETNQYEMNNRLSAVINRCCENAPTSKCKMDVADFLRKCLTLNPAERINCWAALNHPLLSAAVLPETPNEGNHDRVPTIIDALPHYCIYAEQQKKRCRAAVSVPPKDQIRLVSVPAAQRGSSRMDNHSTSAHLKRRRTFGA
eukprot:Filipodium_phascolosomae@DN138_c0_g1_i1.p1